MLIIVLATADVNIAVNNATTNNKDFKYINVLLKKATVIYESLKSPTLNDLVSSIL